MSVKEWGNNIDPIDEFKAKFTLRIVNLSRVVNIYRKMVNLKEIEPKYVIKIESEENEEKLKTKVNDHVLDLMREICDYFELENERKYHFDAIDEDDNRIDLKLRKFEKVEQLFPNACKKVKIIIRKNYEEADNITSTIGDENVYKQPKEEYEDRIINSNINSPSDLFNLSKKDKAFSVLNLRFHNFIFQKMKETDFEIRTDELKLTILNSASLDNLIEFLKNSNCKLLTNKIISLEFKFRKEDNIKGDNTLSLQKVKQLVGIFQNLEKETALSIKINSLLKYERLEETDFKDLPQPSVKLQSITINDNLYTCSKLFLSTFQQFINWTGIKQIKKIKLKNFKFVSIFSLDFLFYILVEVKDSLESLVLIDNKVSLNSNEILYFLEVDKHKGLGINYQSKFLPFDKISKFKMQNTKLLKIHDFTNSIPLLKMNFDVERNSLINENYQIDRILISDTNKKREIEINDEFLSKHFSGEKCVLYQPTKVVLKDFKVSPKEDHHLAIFGDVFKIPDLCYLKNLKFIRCKFPNSESLDKIISEQITYVTALTLDTITDNELIISSQMMEMLKNKFKIKDSFIKIPEDEGKFFEKIKNIHLKNLTIDLLFMKDLAGIYANNKAYYNTLSFIAKILSNISIETLVLKNETFKILTDTQIKSIRINNLVLKNVEFQTNLISSISKMIGLNNLKMDNFSIFKASPAKNNKNEDLSKIQGPLLENIKNIHIDYHSLMSYIFNQQLVASFISFVNQSKDERPEETNQKKEIKPNFEIFQLLAKLASKGCAVNIYYETISQLNELNIILYYLSNQGKEKLDISNISNSDSRFLNEIFSTYNNTILAVRKDIKELPLAEKFKNFKIIKNKKTF